MAGRRRIWCPVTVLSLGAVQLMVMDPSELTARGETRGGSRRRGPLLLLVLNGAWHCDACPVGQHLAALRAEGAIAGAVCGGRQGPRLHRRSRRARV